jgi:hypothetical protein
MLRDMEKHRTCSFCAFFQAYAVLAQWEKDLIYCKSQAVEKSCENAPCVTAEAIRVEAAHSF